MEKKLAKQKIDEGDDKRIQRCESEASLLRGLCYQHKQPGYVVVGIHGMCCTSSSVHDPRFIHISHWEQEGGEDRIPTLLQLTISV